MLLSDASGVMLVTISLTAYLRQCQPLSKRCQLLREWRIIRTRT